MSQDGGAGCWWGHSAHLYREGQSYRRDFISYSIMLPPPVLNEPVYLVCKWWIWIHLTSCYLTFIMLRIMASLQSNAFCLKYHFEYFMRWLDARISLRKRPVSGLQEAGAAIRVDLLHGGLTWWFFLHCTCSVWSFSTSVSPVLLTELLRPCRWRRGHKCWALGCWPKAASRTRSSLLGYLHRTDPRYEEKAFLIMFNLRLFFPSWTLQIISWLIFIFVCPECVLNLFIQDASFWWPWLSSTAYNTLITNSFF